MNSIRKKYLVFLEEQAKAYKDFSEMDIDQRYQFAQEHGYDPKQPVSKKFMKRIQRSNFPSGDNLKGSAFWIDKNGRYFALDKLDGDRHIYYVVDNPEIFGYTKEEIKRIYEKYGEPDPYDISQNPTEGKAREEIIINILKDGWIRIRNYLMENRWTANIYQLDLDTKKTLMEWSKLIISNGTKDMQFSDIHIDSPNGKIKTDLKSIARGDFGNKNPSYDPSKPRTINFN